MSPLEVLQLVGYSIGAVLPLWMGIQLVSRRRSLSPIERILFALALSMCGWHSSNLIITLHGLFGFGFNHWTTLLRFADTIAVISITFAYSFLLHVHIYLWANASNRPLKRSEKIRIYFSYVPTLFLTVAIYKIWTGHYAPMLSRVHFLVLHMAVWITYVLGLIALTELLIARKSANLSEQRIMRTLAASFVAIGIVILAALALGLGEGTQLGLYLKTIANLGSLLPSALLAYYIYRYRYLELIIEESLIVATFAAVVLAVYLFGIRRIGEWANARYGLRAGVVEAILILALTLLAAPLRSWLEKRFRVLFERETALYREVVAQVGSHVGQFRKLPELLSFIESQTAHALSLSRVRILLQSNENEERPVRRSDESGERMLLAKSQTAGVAIYEDDLDLREHGYDIGYALRREDRTLGLMLIEGSPNALTSDVRAVLEVLAGQVAIAIEDFRLIEENVRLERKVAEGERLAALGQMAAIVAHEVKNPLSAIKSIAQVMGEDEGLKSQHARDLSLIVSETDRLSKSVTQLLSFASKRPPAAPPSRADELVRSVAALFRADAEERQIVLQYRIGGNVALNGVQTAAIRDSLSNLVLNALQATPSGGGIVIESSGTDQLVIFSVSDTGAGVSAEMRGRIWGRFFPTRRRGTGLGLAIVRKRMEEAGGSARLAPATNGGGARFELRLPVAQVANLRERPTAS